MEPISKSTPKSKPNSKSKLKPNQNHSNPISKTNISHSDPNLHSDPNSFVYVNNTKLGVPLNTNNNSRIGIPTTIGIATGTISPNTVEAVSRATKHHENMANVDFNKNYTFIRKSKVPSIALGAPKLPRSRDKRAASVDSPPYNPLIDNKYTQNRIQFDNPSSLMPTRGKKPKRKILLSKAMNNMNNVRNMNKNINPFNKKNVNITPPSQTIYNRDNRDNSPSPSPYDLSPYSSDKSKNRLPPKKLFNQVNINEQRKNNYANLRNRRTPKDNNNMSSRANSAAKTVFRRQKKKQQKRKSFKISQSTQSYVEDY